MKKQKTVFLQFTNMKIFGQNITKIGTLVFILLLNLLMRLGYYY